MSNGIIVPLNEKQLRQLQIIKTVAGPTKYSSRTLLIAGNLWRKKFDPNNPTQLKAFAQEMQILDKLRGCDFAQQLVYVDFLRNELYMTAAGAPLIGTEIFFQRGKLKISTEEIAKTLAEKYNIIRLSRRVPGQASIYLSPSILSRDKSTGKLMVGGFDDVDRWKLLNF